MNRKNWLSMLAKIWVSWRRRQRSICLLVFRRCILLFFLEFPILIWYLEVKILTYLFISLYLRKFYFYRMWLLFSIYELNIGNINPLSFSVFFLVLPLNVYLWFNFLGLEIFIGMIKGMVIFVWSLLCTYSAVLSFLLH